MLFLVELLSIICSLCRQHGTIMTWHLTIVPNVLWHLNPWLSEQTYTETTWNHTDLPLDKCDKCPVTFESMAIWTNIYRDNMEPYTPKLTPSKNKTFPIYNLLCWVFKWRFKWSLLLITLLHIVHSKPAPEAFFGRSFCKAFPFLFLPLPWTAGLGLL